mmetsp:Transcript_97038/g.273770  ORF Transcript_97038/g.273770 Transcript_97038/m.273770 type:complete len:165 (+) Transcript_97038:160-654(+)
MHMTQNALVPTRARQSNPQTGRQILEQERCPGRPLGLSIERRGTTSKLAQIAPKRPGTTDAEIHTGSRSEGADLHRRRLLAKPGSSKLREHRALAVAISSGVVKLRGPPIEASIDSKRWRKSCWKLSAWVRGISRQRGAAAEALPRTEPHAPPSATGQRSSPAS